MTYEDLLLVPYKVNGRTVDGMDCYGLVLECCRRTGQSLRDVVYESDRVSTEQLRNYTASLNVQQINRPVRYGIVQSEFEGSLHIGFLVDKKTAIHATYNGVRVTPVMMLKNTKYFEVIE